MSDIKSRDKSKKRAMILSGAIDVFVNFGYELASMDKIAQAAGVSKRTVYNHFGSKDNLFEVIIDDFLAQRHNLKNIIYDSKRTLEEQLWAFANSEIFMIDTKERLGLSKFLAGVFLNDTDYAKIMIEKYPPAYDMLLNWLQDAKRDGKIKSENLLLSAKIFYSMINGAISWPALFTNGIEKTAIEPLVNEIIETFLVRYGK